jgi:predicted ATPase
MEKVKRIVLAGGPCCGKTTLIKELEKRGERVVHESAREVLAEKNYPNLIELQREIFRRQIERENTTKGVCFMDRSALEGIAYCLLRNRIIPDFLNSFDFSGRYHQVFLLERFPLEKDGLRVERDEDEANRVHDMISRVYKERGHYPIHVPRMPISERADFLLSYAKELKGGEK